MTSACYNNSIITKQYCNMPTSITVVQSDGTIWTTGEFTQVTPPALPAPEDVEIDVVLSDGSTKKFVPAA
jgi:hypothetical protein